MHPNSIAGLAWSSKILQYPHHPLRRGPHKVPQCQACCPAGSPATWPHPCKHSVLSDRQELQVHNTITIPVQQTWHQQTNFLDPTWSKLSMPNLLPISIVMQLQLLSPLSQHRGCWFRSQGMRMTWPQKSINDWHWIQSEMLKSSRVLTKCRKQTFHHWQLWICSLLGTRTDGSRRPALLSFLRSNVSWIEELRPIEIHFSLEEAGHELSELSLEMLSLSWQGHETGTCRIIPNHVDTL